MRLILLAAIIIIGATLWLTLHKGGDTNPVLNHAMRIVSVAFEANGSIPAKYTCEGGNVNPPLQISGIPSNAKSLVLIVDDPDAPVGTWVHWTLWNIPPPDAAQTEVRIAEGSVPRGAIEGKTNFNEPGYGGPCPPSGEHRYFFKAYALDTTLDLAPTAEKRELMDAVQDHVLDSAELIGRYSRK